MSQVATVSTLEMTRSAIAALPKLKVSALTRLEDQRRQVACAHQWVRIPLSTVFDYIVVDRQCWVCATYGGPSARVLP